MGKRDGDGYLGGEGMSIACEGKGRRGRGTGEEKAKGSRGTGRQMCSGIQ